MIKKLLLCVAVALMFCAVPSQAQLKVPCEFSLIERTEHCIDYPCADVDAGPNYTYTQCIWGGTLACSWRSGSGECCSSKYDSDTLYDPTRYWEQCEGDAGTGTKSNKPSRHYKLQNPEFARLLVFNPCLGTYDAIELVRVNPNDDVYWRP